MSGIQTIDETMRAQFHRLLSTGDLEEIAHEAGFSLRFVRSLLNGELSLTRETQIIVHVAKSIVRKRTL